MRALFTAALAALGATYVEATKILMAGDFDKDSRPFYESIAKAVSENADYDNTVYVMTTELAAMEIEKVSDRLYKYGVGNDYEFKYDCHASEPENYSRLDL